MWDVGINSVLQICVEGVCENMNIVLSRTLGSLCPVYLRVFHDSLIFNQGVLQWPLSVASYIEEEDYQVNEDTPFKNVPSSGGTK